MRVPRAVEGIKGYLELLGFQTADYHWTNDAATDGNSQSSASEAAQPQKGSAKGSDSFLDGSWRLVGNSVVEISPGLHRTPSDSRQPDTSPSDVGADGTWNPSPLLASGAMSVNSSSLNDGNLEPTSSNGIPAASPSPSSSARRRRVGA